MSRNASLAEVDPVIANAVDNEVARQANGLELIASEKYVS
jgi:glycine/serine hydroxymethyltransferase